MARSMVGRIMDLARPIPFNSKWNTATSAYGSYGSDRYSMLQAMTGTGTLFAIVQLLSQGQAKSVWRMYRTPTDGRVRYAKTDVGSDMREEILKHPALALWKRPNPFMTGNDFREIGWQFMELVGEWYWVLNRGPSGTGIPIEIWPVRPDRMEPVPSRENFLAGWIYTGPNGEEVPLTIDEVIQLKYPNPADPYRGLSAVQSLLADIDNAKYSAQWSRNFFLNGAVPGGIVTFAKRLSEPEFEEFTTRWREQHQGVARGHRVGVLEQGALWTPNTYSMRDMQFPELRKMSRDVIREAYRIHQAMLGNSDDVNRANAQTAEEVHVAWHEVTRMERTRNVLNDFYLPLFGQTAPGREFDFKDPTPVSSNDANEEMNTKSKGASLLVAAGYDPADVLQVVGLPPMKFTGPPLSAGVKTPSPRPALTGPTQDPAENPKVDNFSFADFDDDELLSLAGVIRSALHQSSTNGHARR